MSNLKDKIRGVIESEARERANKKWQEAADKDTVKKELEAKFEEELTELNRINGELELLGAKAGLVYQTLQAKAKKAGHGTGFEVYVCGGRGSCNPYLEPYRFELHRSAMAETHAMKRELKAVAKELGVEHFIKA